MSVRVYPEGVMFDGIVRSVSGSLIPQVYIVSIEGPGVKATFDIHRSLKVLNVNDRVRVTISKSRPAYRDGVDLVMMGYVMSKKFSEGQATRLLISLWGYLLILESSDTELFKVFDYMDEVYFKLEVL